MTSFHLFHCIPVIKCTCLLDAGMRAGRPPSCDARPLHLLHRLRDVLPAGWQVTKLCEFPSGEGGDSVCSVSWSQRGTFLAVGTNTGEVQIWDVAKVKL